MMFAMGWEKLQTSQSVYASSDNNDVDLLDDHLNQSVKLLFEKCRDWLMDCGNPFLCWTLTDELNNERGLLGVHTSRNHRASAIWPLLDFIAAESKGSYGLSHVWDDENGTQFEVWRIWEGKVSEHPDPYFSPTESKHAFFDYFEEHRK